MAGNANTDFEQQHLNNLGTYQKEVEAEYIATIEQIFQTVALYSFADQVFKLSDYPALKYRIDEILRNWRDRVYNILTRSIRREWSLSEAKNEAVLKETYGEVSERVLEQMKNKPEAVTEFIERKTRRIPLSERVWKLHGQFYEEIEKTLYAGIGEGKSARTMATDMKRFLKEPDRLFRRVRDAKGRLSLSGPARKYRPGRGIYRSSFQNALRLTAHETNVAYRTADVQRWRNTKFVLGYEIRLSPNHPTNDEAVKCHLLQGIYPVSFNWDSWHIKCICRAFAYLPTLEEYKKYEDAILNGTDAEFKFDKVKDVPAEFKNYVAANRERFEGWKIMPQWIKQNPKFTAVE